MDLVEYYLSVGDGIVNALRERPCMLHRFPTGVSGEKVHQKRLPKGAPPWMETVRVHFPRWNRTADELCVTELAQVVWAVQMSTVEFHPWNSRRADTEKPDWWRKDRDPAQLFVDYNQNARDHTIAAAYSVRGNPIGTVSAPISWDEVDDVHPDDFTIATMPERFADLGDLHAGIDDAVFDIATLLEWAERDEEAGAEPPADPDED
jgi:DNA primase